MEKYLHENLINLNKKFNALKKIKEGDKPYYNEEVIDIDETSYYQGIYRYITGKDRNVFIKKFEDDIVKLKLINYQIFCNSLNIIILPVLFPNLKELYNTISKITKYLIKAIDILLITYKDDIEYCENLKNLSKVLKEMLEVQEKTVV